MKKIFLIFIFAIYSFAITPFSTEGLKSVNVKVFDKSKLIPKPTLMRIQENTIKELKNLGIEDKSDSFSNFIIKIEVEKVADTFVVHSAILIVEDIIPARDKELQGVGLTYYKDDFIQTKAKELETDLYESIVDYLVFDFTEQYKSEN